MSTYYDESDSYLARINEWLVPNIEGIKPDNRKIYTKLFYANNLATERRILAHLTHFPNWLRENNVDEYDAEDILEYLQTKGLVTTPSAVPTSGTYIWLVTMLLPLL